MTSFVVAAVHDWNRRQFAEYSERVGGDWHLFTEPEQLEREALESLEPRYIFFPHWSWRVPDEIVERWECVCFHMTDVPYGRGGSPLQNLILRGHTSTVVSALRMTGEMDAGPVYDRCPVELDGRAQDVYERVAGVVGEMIVRIADNSPEPVPQSGDVVSFRRRTPDESEIPTDIDDLGVLYDFIRMVDADGYPHAFVRHGDLRIEFTRAEFDGRDLRASVSISLTRDDQR